jgi:DNA polymerase III delta prime subunit
MDELNLPEATISQFQKMEETGFPMNMIFYGQPGIGKTSAARMLIRNSDALELNGSHNDGDKTMVNNILNFSRTLTLFGKPKVVFIDEADYMSKQLQDALRNPIEAVSDNTRFILTANDYKKLTLPLRSRFLEICFDVPIIDQPSVQERIVERYQRRLTELGIEISPNRLKEIVGTYFPDLRKVANQIEFEVGF